MWEDRALCRAKGDPEDWFSDEPSRMYRAKITCMACPVRAACEAVGRERVHQLDPSLRQRPETLGVYGGMSGRELAEAEGRPNYAPRMLTRDQGISLLARGASVLAIARALGVSPATVRAWATAVHAEAAA